MSYWLTLSVYCLCSTDFSESWSFRPYLLFDVSTGKEKSAGAG